ncbi:glycoside-pentoside-hexuronide (GPH):cation symporter [Secundilactobacillus hailunensis]|uniref:Glycoside-pentoside-hexuronide (GPH):cation symporter n=1 Tax=Secundilactobacillus hailunensis TaxID=2559923 RepID=A0ABW1T9Q8_9LACO|nr:PTS sugar transporter subunit IIA [Secundilactobacillus hailunensis]
MENTGTGVEKKHLTRKQWIERITFALGNLGHSAFYGAMSTYFIVYVTSGMFTGMPKSIANKLIGLVTGLVVVIRLAEIVVDPILGNIVDNTKSRWGKFKPWQVIGGIISTVLMVILFSGIFGLAKVNWLLFAVVFVILFISLDIFYSLVDVSYWGMVPAISEDSRERGIFTSLGAFTGSIGWNGLAIIVVPVVTYFTYLSTGKRTEGAPGWLVFGIIVSVIALLCALAVAFGTKEKHNVIRAASDKKTTIKSVFVGIAKNDQILWTSLAYLCYSLAYVTTNGILFYYFKFVLGHPGEFWIAGIVATIVGFCTSPLYPILNRFISRKVLFSIGQSAMILSYVIFIAAKLNLSLVIVGLVLFNFNFAQLVTVLTLTDSIEYGQLKNGNRNEAVTLTIRPMIDKISASLSNGMVGSIALVAGMTGSATAADMTANNIHTFELFAFYTPLVFSILALGVFLWKVKITEKKHAEIVEQLQIKLASGKVNNSHQTDAKLNSKKHEQIIAPVSGELDDLTPIKTKIKGFTGKGFAIQPSEGKIYAPFDGMIKFTFATRHTLGIVSDNGLEAVIHVGIGTVNLRGRGFISKYTDGQKVHAGDLLLTFDQELIQQAGYDDVVVLFLTQPEKVDITVSEKISTVKHGDPVMTVSAKN